MKGKTEVARWLRALGAAATAPCAKGGRRESDYTLAFDRHPRLRAAVLALSREAR